MKKHNGLALCLSLVFSFLLASCNYSFIQKPAESSSSNPVNNQPASKPDAIHQWAVSAKASSQYSDPNWAASQAIGEPDVFVCGDNIKAWAAEKEDSIEWIDLDYSTPVIPSEINIYQNYKPSQVTEVALFTPNGKKYIAWEGYPEKVKNCPDLMTVTVNLDKKVAVNKIRVTLDQRVNGWGWNEIDAVELVGTNP
ncbi:MAG TPA: discoidin domain-containing protein [Leptolinea sp.]